MIRSRSMRRDFHVLGLPRFSYARLNSGLWRCEVMGYCFFPKEGDLFIHVRLINHPTLDTIIVRRSRLPARPTQQKG